ncbi:phosphatidylinositol-3,4,5-trisphosphate binding [Balamuthia mandrillaris]
MSAEGDRSPQGSGIKKEGSATGDGSRQPGLDRAQLMKLEERTESLLTHLKRITARSGNYSETGAFEHGIGFAEELSDMAFTGFTHNQGERLLFKHLQLFGATFKELELMRQTMLQQMQAVVTEPLEEFAKMEVKASMEMKKRVAKSRDHYEASRLKFDVSRTSKKNKSASGDKTEKQTESELADLKRNYELAHINYLTKLSHIEAKKNFEILERMCAMFFAQKSYFQQSLHLLHELEPSLRKLMQELESQRRKYVQQMNDIDVTEILASKMAQQTESLEKQGYLTLKQKGTTGKRRWFLVADGNLHIHKKWKELTPLKTLDLLLASVKPISEAEPPHKPFMFSVVFPSDSMILQAVSEKDRKEWLDVIQNSIAFRLKQMQSVKETKAAAAAAAGNSSSGGDTSPGSGSDGQGGKEKLKPLEQLRVMSEANRYCADCNRADPDWASINLGCIICYECSGVHRSLGVHISRVRSLSLDTWEPELFMLMKTIGNTKANGIWEQKLPLGTKPTEKDDRATKEKYIRDKYEHKKFIQKPSDDQETLRKRLLEEVLENNLLQVYKLLAWGAPINWQDPDQEKRSLLHQAVIQGKTNLFCLELLIQMGAKVYAVDDLGRSPLHWAAVHDRAEMARLLLNRGADARLQDNQGKTAVELANEHNSKAFLALSVLLEKNEEGEKEESAGGSSSSSAVTNSLVHSSGAMKTAASSSTSSSQQQEVKAKEKDEESVDKEQKERRETEEKKKKEDPKLATVKATIQEAIEQVEAKLREMKKEFLEDLSKEEEGQKERTAAEDGKESDGLEKVRETAKRLRAVKMMLCQEEEEPHPANGTGNHASAAE